MAGFSKNKNKKIIFSLACGQIWLDVLAFSSSNLVPHNKPKVPQTWFQVFSTLTPTLKQALVCTIAHATKHYF
jgi:hypothetical protein